MQQQQLDQQAPAGSHDALSLSGVLENIMRFVPQNIRLATCSRVCTSWRAAAVTVTAEAGVSARGSAGLLAWLDHYGERMQSLSVQNGSMTVHSSLAVLHQLTRLELECVTAHPALLSTVGDNMKVG